MMLQWVLVTFVCKPALHHSASRAICGSMVSAIVMMMDDEELVLDLACVIMLVVLGWCCTCVSGKWYMFFGQLLQCTAVRGCSPYVLQISL